MIKQNGCLENLLVFQKLTQSRLVPIHKNGQSELDWLSFWKKKMLVFKIAILCVCVCGWGQGGGDGGMCGGGSVGVLMRFVWRSLGVQMGVLGGSGVGVWYGWVGEWVLDKWHSLYANTHYKHEYSVLNSIWPKSGLSEVLEKHSSNYML